MKWIYHIGWRGTKFYGYLLMVSWQLEMVWPFMAIQVILERNTTYTINGIVMNSKLSVKLYNKDRSGQCSGYYFKLLLSRVYSFYYCMYLFSSSYLLTWKPGLACILKRRLWNRVVDGTLPAFQHVSKLSLILLPQF